MKQTSNDEARLRLAAIVDSSQDAIVSKTLDGTITSWNNAARQMFGYTEEEILGKPIFILIPPELHHEEVEVLRRLRLGERIEHYETVRLRKDGSLIEVSLTISPVRDDFGNIIGASKIARDISDRRRSDEARFRLAAIIESSDDAIVSKDLNGIITTWNRAAERLFGYTAEEIVGKSVLSIIPPELQSEEPVILENLRSGRKIDHYETERVRKDGRRIAVSLTISPIRDRSGRVIGASKIARDISDRKRVQEALIESEKLAATGRTAAAIAHEINNPLEAVTNLAYLLTIDSSLNPTAHSYATMLLEEISRVSKIAKQTLAFYREAGKPSEFEITEILDNILVLNRPTFEKRRIDVRRDYRSSRPLHGHPLELRQVLLNLITNAMEAVRDGGRIVVRVSTSHGYVRVTVADNGSGISRENRARLFEPFFTTKESRGNGLGLWVSRGIAHKYGGTIKVRSCTSFGRSGSVFCLLLPAAGATSTGLGARARILPFAKRA